MDVLVAFNQDAYDTHVSDVREGGVIIYNSEEFQLEGNSAPALGLPIEELARSTGNNRAANMVVIGVLAHLVDMPQQHLHRIVRWRFVSPLFLLPLYHRPSLDLHPKPVPDLDPMTLHVTYRLGGS